jgi:hypothetical protein
MSSKDLWGAVPNPVTDSVDVILREQGKILAEKTQGEVQGYVPVRSIGIYSDKEEDTQDPFVISFYLETPAFHRYRHLFLTVELPASFNYPVTVVDHINGDRKICRSRTDFEDVLHRAFTSRAVREVLVGLRTVARTAKEKEQL